VGEVCRCGTEKWRFNDNVRTTMLVFQVSELIMVSKVFARIAWDVNFKVPDGWHHGAM
jgi:hypothetical protein